MKREKLIPLAIGGGILGLLAVSAFQNRLTRIDDAEPEPGGVPVPEPNPGTTPGVPIPPSDLDSGTVSFPPEGQVGGDLIDRYATLVARLDDPLTTIDVSQVQAHVEMLRAAGLVDRAADLAARLIAQTEIRPQLPCQLPPCPLGPTSILISRPQPRPPAPMPNTPSPPDPNICRPGSAVLPASTNVLIGQFMTLPNVNPITVRRLADQLRRCGFLTQVTQLERRAEELEAAQVAERIEQAQRLQAQRRALPAALPPMTGVFRAPYTMYRQGQQQSRMSMSPSYRRRFY